MLGGRRLARALLGRGRFRTRHRQDEGDSVCIATPTIFRLPLDCLLQDIITVFSLHATMAQQIHQPIHPSMIPRLDPEYVDFHNKFIATIVPPHTLPWDPAMRNGPAVPGGSHPLPVGKTEDIDMTHTGFRAFTPEGISPANGWPCFIFFHGGPSSSGLSVFFLTWLQADGHSEV